MIVGEIKITYELAPDGDVITTLNVEGDLHVATQLGLLELAKDTILHGEEEEVE